MKMEYCGAFSNSTCIFLWAFIYKLRLTKTEENGHFCGGLLDLTKRLGEL